MGPTSPSPRPEDVARRLGCRREGTSEVELPAWVRVAIVLAVFGLPALIGLAIAVAA